MTNPSNYTIQYPGTVPTTVDFSDVFVRKELWIDANMYSTGQNNYGGIANNTASDYSSPVQIGSMSNWKQASGGWYQSAFIKEDGSLWTVGYGAFGQLGNNTTNINYSSPIQIGSMYNWEYICSSKYDMYCIKSDRTLWSWGYNASGQLGNNTIIDYSSPIQIGTLTNWKQIASGDYFALAIKTDNTLWAWGLNDYGQLGNGTVNIYYSSPIQIGSSKDWKQIACGRDFTWAIKTDGTLWTWGRNSNGQLANQTTINYSSPIQIGTDRWKQVSCGAVHGCGIKIDNIIWGVGGNSTGAIGNLNPFMQTPGGIPWGSPAYFLHQYADYINNVFSTDVYWNDVLVAYDGTQCITSIVGFDGKTYEAEAFIPYYTFAGDWDELWYPVRISNPIYTEMSSPIMISPYNIWKQVSCGFTHTMATTTDAFLFGWGYNANGQLGNGTINNLSAPTQINFNNNIWKSVACGTNHSIMISSDDLKVNTF